VHEGRRRALGPGALADPVPERARAVPGTGVNRFVGALPRFALRRPRATLVAGVLFALAPAAGLLRLRLETDGHTLVPPDDPAIRFDARIRRQFGITDPVVLVVRTTHPKGIWNEATLRRVRELSEAALRLEGIAPTAVTSLATEVSFRTHPGTFDFKRFLDPLPRTAEELEGVRRDVEWTGILKGTLVSTDGSAAAVLVGMPGGRDRTALVRRLEELGHGARSDTDDVLVVGAPVAEATLGTHLLQDLAGLLPAALTVLFCVIWVGCRRAAGGLIALLEVGSALVWTFGLMGLAGVPVYLTTAVLPVILTAVGLTDEVHVFWHYQRHLDLDPDRPRQALDRTLAELVGPVTLTGLTTFFAFLSFSASPIAPVQAFSLFTSLGMLFCMLWSLTVVPATLALLPARWMRRPGAGAGGGGPGRVARALTALAQRPRVVLPVLIGFSLVALWGLRRLEVQDSWIEGFAPGSRFRRDTAFVNRSFFGTHLLVAHVGFAGGAGGAPAAGAWTGPLLAPSVLQAVARFEDAARSLPGVGGVLGPWSHLLAVTAMSVTFPDRARAELATEGGIAKTLTRFDALRGAHRRREVISDDLREWLVTVFLKDANFRDTARLMDALRAAALEHLGGAGGGVAFAGDVGVSQAMIPAIVRTQVTSLLLTLGAAFVVVALLGRSLGRAALSVLPAALAVGWVFGAMGWTGMPLGVATSMFCAITLGVGVDFAIHLLDRVRRLRAEGAARPVARALEEAGPAIVGDTLAVALGFGVLAFSRVPANGRLGLLVAGALLSSCLLTLVGLPALAGKESGPREAAGRSEQAKKRAS